MVDNERKKRLQETLKKFNKDQKSEVFTFGNEIVNLDLIPSGVKEVDDFIGGGFKQGAHTIVWGQYSVGKTALILTTIANAQKLGKIVAYVNSEKPIDKERFEFFGIDLSELVYIEAPDNAEQALSAMRTLCRDMVVDLFIIDSINGLCPKSSQETKEGAERDLEKKDVAALALTLSNFYNKVNALVFKAKAAVIWIGQARTQGIGSYFVRQGLSGGNAQTFYAYQIIQMRKDEKSNNPTRPIRVYTLNDKGKLTYKTIEQEIGFGIVCKLEKTNSSKSALQNKELKIPYYFATGFKTPPEVEVEIQIEGTNEEKEIIKEMLEAKKQKENPIKDLIDNGSAILTEPKKLEQKPSEVIFDDVMPVTEKKKRGRKAGSKNKVKNEK